MTSPNLKSHLSYKKFINKPKILLLDTGYLVTKDVIDAAENLGINLFSLKTQGTGQGSDHFIKNLLESLIAFKPDFLMSINHLGFDSEGVLTKLLAEYKIPMLSWFVDNPLFILGESKKNVSSWMQVFSFERNSIKYLKKLGFDNPVYMPTGCNRKLFHEKIASSIEKTPLSFVGNSWWDKGFLEPNKKIQEAAKRILKGCLIEEIIHNNSFSYGSKIKDNFKLNNEEFSAVLACAVARKSMERRVNFIKTFQNENICVYGDKYWADLIPDLSLKNRLEYSSQLPDLFKNCDFNTNISAFQMPTALNQRVWNVPGTGSLLITDFQEDLEEFFIEGEDLVSFKSNQEALEKYKFYKKNLDLREKIAKKAFKKIIRYHTVSHRLREMLKVMKSKFI